MGSPLVNKAMEIALRAHHGQINNHDGEPYILHVHRVAMACVTHGAMATATAWLHDVVEDNSEWNLQRIQTELIGLYDPFTNFKAWEHIPPAIDALSKRKNEPLEEYYTRVKMNSLATTVKLADIRDNFRRNHLIQDEETRLRMAKKYSLGIDMLS